ncbi:DDE-type integrase/transposase/recombinase [Klebsiella pneumoniae]|uniref:reverse transcriptase domain-containing protein n=1 Tax=Klebsiella pneumoniae TaxID=573 RepID=UPI001E47162E|nr:reverse transcriptase domain-containing protein [Klebsiella pneumoniae]MCD1431043.1 DDE-type integrase/transposase/recombinase [Klebsiella pneumoniae]
MDNLEEKLIDKVKQELSENSVNLEKKLTENNVNLEKKLMENCSNLEEKIIENSVKLENKLLENLENKLIESSTSLKEELLENTNCLKSEVMEKISNVEESCQHLENRMEEKIKEMEIKIANLNFDSKSDGQLSSSVDGSEVVIEPVLRNEERHVRMKPPQFDGKTSWSNYHRQFEAAAKVNGWSSIEKATALTLALRGDATNVLQTLAVDEQENYDRLVQHLEMRYGQAHLEHVYHSELKNRCQKTNETLQEFEADIARLVRLAYPATPENVLERLAVQAFLDGVRGEETRQALLLARPTKLVDALARALEFEAVRSRAKGPANVRGLEGAVVKTADSLEARVRRVVDEIIGRKERLQSRKAGRARCPCKKERTTELASENVERAREVGLTSNRIQHARKDIVKVASVRQLANSVFVDGLIFGKQRALLLDTGATKTIIRPDIAKASTKILPTRWRLRTATGDPVTIHGEMDVTLAIGNASFEHRVLVAEIENEVILGMDIMNARGFELNFNRGILKINNDEVILHKKNEEIVCVTLAEDTSVPEQTEVILAGCLRDCSLEGTVMMFEPRVHDQEVGRGIAVGKSLVNISKAVPVRVMNTNYYPVTLRKGTVLGHCCSISSVVRSVSAPEKPDKKSLDEVKDLLSESRKNLTLEQKKKFDKLLNEYYDVFDTGHGSKGRTNVTQHKIDTGNARPIRQTARRLPLAKREEADRIVQEMAKEGVIEPSGSPWASPVVLVKKKDGSTRFCVDYRQLNNVTKKDSYPLPRIDDTLDTLAGSRIFSTLDLKSGYWQVELAPEDKEKTAFTVGTGLWQFTVMPFGLCNAPATFERLMDTVLKGLSWKTCLVYLDDIIVVGKTFEDHLRNLEEVFQRLRNSGLRLSSKKCHLFQREVQYLGHVVSSEGVAVDKKKVESVKEWPVPTDKHELRSFLGLCTYYRRFVPGFANIAKPLTRLTEEDRKYAWDDECEKAFQHLKMALTTAPILGYPQPTGKYILDTDASNVGIGSVLSQVQDGQERVIGYFSKTLSKPERNYCVTRRELLAVVKSMEHFYKYLYGKKFLLRTDHAALQWLLRFKNPEGQVARWIERLQEFDFDTEHRAGNLHKNADALSRRPCSEDCKHCFRAEEKDAMVRRTVALQNLRWQPDDIRRDQEEDPDLKAMIKWKEDGRKPTWNEVAPQSPKVKSLWAQWESIVLSDGLLKRVLEDTDGGEERKQLIVPKSRRAEILREVHDGATGGHLGVAKTLGKLRDRFYWVGCKADVKDWCRKCTVCAASNGPQKHPKARMRQYNVGSPFERIAVDVAGPFPETSAGNKYILVVMDYFSKWVEAYALKNQEAETVADVLVKEWVCRFGVPLELHSDQGRNFESTLFQNVCKVLGIKKTRTTALHPQSDGMVERMNRTINRYLAKVVSDHQRDWDQFLHLFLMAYRSSVHETTGQTPSSIVMGRELRLPCDLKFGSPPGDAVAGEDYVSELRDRMADIHERVRHNIQTASDRMKETYDVKASEGGYQPKDLVWLHNPRRRRGFSPKLQSSWEGPYEVVKRINDVIYRIRKLPKGKAKVVHFNRLSPYAGNNPEQPDEAEIRSLECQLQMSFDDFMTAHSTGSKSRYGVTREEARDLFEVPQEYSLVHCVAQDLKMSRGIAAEFRKRYGRLRELQKQNPRVGRVLRIHDHQQSPRSFFYLVTKSASDQKPTYKDVWKALNELKAVVLFLGIKKLAMPKIGCGIDGLDWRIVRSMLEVLFRSTTVEILVCCWNPWRASEKTVDCFFYQMSRCNKGASCKFRHPPSITFRDEMSLRRGQCNRRVRHWYDDINDFRIASCNNGFQKVPEVC